MPGPGSGAINDANVNDGEQRPAKQRHTWKRIFERLKEEHAVTDNNWLEAAFTGGAAQNTFRSANNFAMIGGFTGGGHVSYHSLQALFRAQTGAYSTIQAAYTWSHSIGDVELENSSGGVNQEAIANQYNTALDKGNTNINRPNIFLANKALFLPKFNNRNKLVQNTAGGWEAKLAN